MRRFFSRFTATELLMVLFAGVIIICLTVAGYSIYLYQTIENNKADGLAEAETRATEETALVNIEETVRYHGSTLYFVATGTNEQGEELMVFVPGTEEGELLTFSMENLMSENQVISAWNQQCSDCSLVEYNWAIENEIPLMEVTYMSQNDRYVLEYYNLENGKTYQRLPLEKTIY